LSCKQPPDEQNLPKKLDMIDRKILDVLQADGRISLAELASNVGLSASLIASTTALEAAMMDRRRRDRRALSINFRLDERVPKNHLLRGGGSRRHARGAPPYDSEIGRPSVDPDVDCWILLRFTLGAQAF
jgi:AsnC-type helix-turn-helix domain